MKIIHIVENLDDTYGGPSRSIPALTSGLSYLDCSTEICTLQWRKNEFCSSADALSVNIKKFHCVSKQRLNFSFGLAYYLLKNSDANTIFHVHNLWNAVPLVVYLVARLKGIRYVVSPRGSLYEWSLSQGKYRKKIAWYLFQRSMLNSADFIHVTAKSEKEALLQLNVLAPIKIVPNALSVPIITRPKFSNSKHLSVLYASRIHPKKGIEILLDAWSNFSRHYPFARLTICGTGRAEYVAKIKRQVKDMKLENSIEFIGHVSDERTLCHYYKNADLFVLPSYSENFGMSVLEALANGCIVITTKNTPWQILQRVRCGWWIPLNSQNIRNAFLEYIQTDQESRKIMKETSIKIASRYLPYKICKKMLHNYLFTFK